MLPQAQWRADPSGGFAEVDVWFVRNTAPSLVVSAAVVEPGFGLIPPALI